MIGGGVQTVWGYVRVLTAQDDLNNLIQPGFYSLSTGNVPQNSYFQNDAIVEVFKTDSNRSRIMQRETRTGTTQSATRVMDSGIWHGWLEHKEVGFIEREHTNITLNDRGYTEVTVSGIPSTASEVWTQIEDWGTISPYGAIHLAFKNGDTLVIGGAPNTTINRIIVKYFWI